MISRFQKQRVKDSDLKDVQDEVASVFDQLTGRAIVDGRLIDDVFLDGTDPTTINHGMSRAIRGYLVVRQDAEATIWETESVLPLKTLVLNASADVTVSLWVF